MSRAESLPEVLSPGNGYSAISMRRALKQVVSLLERVDVPADDHDYDMLLASMDDLETMIASIR